MKHTLTQDDLRQFTGTETWYRLTREILYTDGAQYVAEMGRAYWLLFEIAFAQISQESVAAEPFQLWKLKVRADRSAVLTCQDGNCKTVFEKTIEFTDFPLTEVTFYVTNKTILLPSEY